MKKIGLLLLLQLFVVSMFAQDEIKGLSEKRYTYISGAASPVNPCDGENLQISLNSYPDTTVEKSVTLTGKIVGVKDRITTISINNINVARQQTHFNTSFDLQIGENKLKIEAFSTCSNTPVIKTISITRKIKRQDYALFFVIDDAKGYTPINNAPKDAKKFKDLLETNYNFNVEVVNNPTQQDFLTTIERYNKISYNKNDQLLVYLIGHGDIEKMNGTTLDNYFVFQDGKLTQKMVTNSLNALPVNHILFIANTCYSGASVLQSNFKPSVKNELTLDERINDLLKKKKTRKIIAAGPDLVPAGFESSLLITKIIQYLENHSSEIVTYQTLSQNAITDFKYQNGTKPLYGYFGDDQFTTTFIFVPRNMK